MIHSHGSAADLHSLETSAQLAGAAWACAFSSSDEFETALIRTRRAQGRYARSVRWSALLWTGSALAAAGLAFLML
ncbi:MAG: hypothetical protein EPO23_01920 [Xanthobacteraceae bacterium]|nr:MAG: hypothetical protein EPO23_01920 [Xanthobacteraceae bacterium]